MSTRQSVFASGMRLFFWTLLLSCSAVHAAKFDERIKAPRATSAAEFKRSARDYFAAYAQREKDAAESDDLIRDPKAYDRWLDLEWMLERGIPDPSSLEDLQEFGMRRSQDGSYTVRVKEYPQWMPIDVALMPLRVPSVYESYARDLKARGFRDQDLAVLKNYIDSNNWERDAYIANKPLTESFAQRAQLQNQVSHAVNQDETWAYMYQVTRNSLQARRNWAIGLLDTLDKQRQRILVSYLREFDVTRTYGPLNTQGPSRVQRVEASLLSGEYAQELKQQELRTRQ